MAQKAPQGQVKVVVVEDDPTFLSFWRRLLTDMGLVDVVFLPNPESAQRLLAHIPCTLLISDVNMPAISGYELARIACEKNPECRIILTTAYNTDLSRFDIEGCSFHLLFKPYTNVFEVVKLVRHLLEGRGAFEEFPEESFSSDEDYPQITMWKL